ncbi:DUF2235 domain-containing protein [Pseudoxanthomonas sp. PXM01]|uniref:phospholipase effector Tle1 domain-containing protein n=1 Tax=Pseudoxanthomonas sp. PXM01 TaxID=2769295 RepID=UPI0017805C17|nr:DUF2235 domain-containing protein [Pseudoxanthomonas sp. PXM01]MBD9471187.1 DUF2235 domain-containing protein [Pseudoxanthomonas sp. PXM01]
MGSGNPSAHRDGGIDVELAGDAGRDSYRRAESDLSQLRIPVLLREDRPHDRLYVAAMDGTGNSMVDDDPEQWSAVAKLYEQIEELKHTRISAGYVEGTYTQNGLLRTPEKWWDGRFGHTFDERVETAYLQFCEQAKKWLDEDPDAQIRLAGVGFSRGAEGIAALERMVHERGIRDPQGAKIERDAEGLVVRVEYADRPLLVEPGKTPQVALLFDPVSTGVEEHDRRLPPSTLTTFQITAQHERRDLFPSSEHVPAGFSEDHRNYNAWVAGAHSDIGDTYRRNGLGTESLNLGVAFLNRLSDRPYLEKRALPEDPDQYVIHRSDQHMAGLYGTKGFDRDGVRDRETDLAPDKLCRRGIVDDCNRKEPIDEALDARFERRTGTMPQPAVRPETGLPASAMEPVHRPGLNDIVEKVSREGASNGAGLMPAVVAEYLRGPWAREFQAEMAKELAARDAASRPAVEVVRDTPEVVR